MTLQYNDDQNVNNGREFVVQKKKNHLTVVSSVKSTYVLIVRVRSHIFLVETC